MRSDTVNYTKKEDIVRLWNNEATRVFVDRLVSSNDVRIVKEDIIPDLIRETFQEEVYEFADAKPLLYGDFMNYNPLEPEL